MLHIMIKILFLFFEKLYTFSWTDPLFSATIYNRGPNFFIKIIIIYIMEQFIDFIWLFYSLYKMCVAINYKNNLF